MYNRGIRTTFSDLGLVTFELDNMKKNSIFFFVMNDHKIF